MRERSMSRYVVLRDTRLTGNLPGSFASWWHNLQHLTVYGAINLRIPMEMCRRFRAQHGRMHSLFILCHGFAGTSDARQQSGDFGGQGLQLGRENVTHENVSDWTGIAGCFENIVVYACAAANTERGAEFTTEDGQYLMGALAIHTRATVYAANRIQWYNPTNFDFGRWEGQLYRFPASGQPPTRVSRPPVEFSSMV
jgi:hypothetical protein